MDGCLLGPPRFTAVPTTPAARAFLIDRRYRSREGGIRASVRGAPLPRPGQKSSYSFLSTKNWRTRDAVDDDVGGVATQFCNLAAAPETRRATAFAPGGIPLYKLSLTQPLIVFAPVPARLAVALWAYGVVQRRRHQ